jgi:hypothetical protein
MRVAANGHHTLSSNKTHGGQKAPDGVIDGRNLRHHAMKMEIRDQPRPSENKNKYLLHADPP